jgi:excinuclease ABC subunit C
VTTHRSGATRREAFADRLKALPPRPGVYIFRNPKGDVVYVGKAASLRSRVRNYFGAPHALEPKTRALVEQIADFEYIVTASAQEALHLEATLVKRHQPFFNVRLKDDKHYPYLRIDVQNDWPRVEIARRVAADGARYFGPYASASSVRTTLNIVKKLFPWRSCTKAITGTDPRPCLDYYIHRCIAPCTGYCSKEEYDAVISQTVLFLEGKTGEVVRSVRRQMEAAAEALDFERAALLRDQLRAIESVAEKQVVERTRPADEDVFGLARDETEGCVQVFFIRGIQMVGRDFFTLDGVKDESDAGVLGSFLKQFYESAVYVPKTVVVPFPVAEANLIADWLSERRGSRVTVAVAQRGPRRKLVDLAGENARESLQMLRVRWLADRDKTERALLELEEELNLPGPPRRIECYDISNFQGSLAVGAMATFEDGRPDRERYRKFRIRTVEGADDFRMMREVLDRRLSHLSETGEEAPDLLVIDGGKGQLGVAEEVLESRGLAGRIRAIALAKERRRRGTTERIFVPGRSDPLPLSQDSPESLLVQEIRDEAHRFAVRYHRELRRKSTLRTGLEGIPGIGRERREKLIERFSTLKGIRSASQESIAEVLGAKLAAEVFRRLHSPAG